MVLLAVIVSLAACLPMTHRQLSVPSRPESRTIPMKSEIVREAVERALIKKDFSLDTAQSKPLHVETEWLEDRDLGYRSLVKADIEEDGRTRTKVTLNMALETKVRFKEIWEPMDTIPIDALRLLLNDIEMESYRVLYDPP